MSKSTLKRASLGNGVMLAPDGMVLCRVAKDRLDWYLKRNLAVEIPNQSYPTIMLNFNPAGRKGADDIYNLEDKENICVTCGCKEHLTKHHIIPYVYRKEFPLELKRHSAYDVMLLCRHHHNKYEIYADLKKRELGIQFDCPLHPSEVLGKDCLRAIKSAFAIVKHRDKIPLLKLDLLKGTIGKYLNKSIEEISFSEIEKLSKKEKETWSDKEHGKKIVEKLLKTENGIYEFSVMWRKHFIEHCKPNFVSKNWDVNKEL